MKLIDIPDHVLADIRERGHTDEQITRMAPRKIFDEYCHWHGLIGWGQQLFDLAITLNSKRK